MQIKPIFEDEKVLPIVFAFNNDYSKYFAVSLQSIINNSSKDKLYDIIVFNTDIEENNKRLLYKMLPKNFSLRFYDISAFIRDFFSEIKLKPLNYWSVEMYYRIFIPFIMPNYSKVLYLDSDIVIEDSLEALFSIDFKNKKLLVVKDSHLQTLNVEKKRLRYNKNSLKLKNPRNYFNSGMILFNIQNINNDEYHKDIINAFQNKNLLFPDQDILNMIFVDNVQFIHCKWNFCCGPFAYDKDYTMLLMGNYAEDYKQALIKPKIIHYTTPRKPWNYKLEMYFELFWKYARLTPFYEEILYKMNQQSTLKIVTESAKYTNLYQQIQNKKKIMFWGASLFLEEFIKRYDLINDNIIGIIDKNPAKQGNFIKEYKIFAPEDLRILVPEVIIITIINSAKERAEDVKNYLKQEGYHNITVKTL